ncbi:hypothetical protein Hanom_Chr00s164079g01826181 [Helianthus anomalus]
MREPKSVMVKHEFWVFSHRTREREMVGPMLVSTNQFFVFFFFFNKKTTPLRGVHPVRFWTRGEL